MGAQQFVIYRIWYKDYEQDGAEYAVYVGRTKQPLRDRLRGHFLSGNAMTRHLSIKPVARVQYAECVSEADMNLYEIYYICKDHPVLNRDDKPKDDLTIELPELDWKLWESPLMDKWKRMVSE